MRILIAPKDEIFLGHVGENYSTQLEFDITEWWNDPRIGPNGAVTIMLRQNCISFPVPDADISVTDGIVNWNVGEMALTIAGRGKLELIYKVGEKIAKSRVWPTLTLNPIDLVTDDPPQIVIESLPEIYQHLDDYIDHLYHGWNGEITFHTTEGSITCQVKSGLLYQDGQLYEGEFTLFTQEQVIRLIIKYGVIFNENDELYTDVIRLVSDQPLYLNIQSGIILSVSNTNPNLNAKNGTGENALIVNDIYKNIASGESAFVEGGQVIIDMDTGLPFDPPLPVNEASGKFSHAEGGSCRATGRQAHAEGCCTLAEGTNSHAQNNHTQALHKDSDAGGTSTITGRPQQTVRGKFNVVDENALFIVGNGTSDTNRKNAFTVSTDGTAKVQKQVVVEGGDPTEDNQLTRKAYVDNKLIYLEVYDLNEASFPFGDSESLVYLYGSSASSMDGGFWYPIDEMDGIWFPSQITRIVNDEFKLIDTEGRVVYFYLEYLNNEFRIADYFIGDNKPATENYVQDYAVQKTNSAYKIYGTNQNGAPVALDFTGGSASGNSIARRTSGGQLFVADPTANGHAATKKYVDEAIQAALGNAIGGSY